VASRAPQGVSGAVERARALAAVYDRRARRGGL